MIEIKLDAEKWMRQMEGGEKQLPFAMSKALNETATDFQTAERNVIASRFTLRRPDFIKRTIKIERGNFATKANLRAIVNVDEKRDLLSKFEKGGDKQPREGRSIAIPVEARRNKSDIVTKGNRPKAYQLQQVSANVAKGLKRTFLIRSADGKGALFQRVGRGKNSTIRNLFSFKSRVPIPKRLSFHDTARKTALTQWPKNMLKAFENAMRTAK
jgi:hypothetical protein